MIEMNRHYVMQVGHIAERNLPFNVIVVDVSQPPASTIMQPMIRGDPFKL